MDNNLLIAFVALTAVAVVIQASIMVAFYWTLKSRTAKMVRSTTAATATKSARPE